MIVVLSIILDYKKKEMAQSAGAVEYIDSISRES